MKTTDLQRIIIQLGHPDAFFYDLQAGKETVSGFFEGDDTGIPFSVDIHNFAVSAYLLGYVAAYGGNGVYVMDGYDGGTDISYEDYAANLIEEGGQPIQQIIRHAIECEWANRISQLAREISSAVASYTVKERIYRTVDASFCDAVVDLAKIIEEANAQKEKTW